MACIGDIVLAFPESSFWLFSTECWEVESRRNQSQASNSTAVNADTSPLTMGQRPMTPPYVENVINQDVFNAWLNTTAQQAEDATALFFSSGDGGLAELRFTDPI